MAVILRVQHIQNSENNKPEDAFVNTWHMQTETTPPPAATMDAISSALQTFYQALAAKFTTQSVAAAWTQKFYNEADPPPRRPIVTKTGALTGLATTNSLPHECTICVSFQANPVSGIPQARRRGRIYLPPMATSVASPGGFVDATHQLAVRTAANALLTASDAAADWSWIVRSDLTGDVAPVASGWVDNAWDTQRRRGRIPTTRSTFP